MGILEEIVKIKRGRLDALKSKVPLSEIRARASEAQKARPFVDAVRGGRGRIRLIAEVKKASPSRGTIREDFDPAVIARIYDGKADAISVLTEEDFFKGDLSYIEVVKRASMRPAMRKDFIFDEYQIYESRAAGADAILLIERVLGLAQAAELLGLAGELGMQVLFEVSDYAGLETALSLDAPIIGINNRDLATMKVDMGVTLRLKKEIPEGKVVVSESGIGTASDVTKLIEAGVDAVLIGTAFMQAADIGKKIDEILGGRNG